MCIFTVVLAVPQNPFAGFAMKVIVRKRFSPSVNVPVRWQWLIALALRNGFLLRILHRVKYANLALRRQESPDQLLM